MTAIIGFCLADGVFLASDSRRTDCHTGRMENIQKLYNLHDRVILITGGLGSYGDCCKDQLAQEVTKDTLIVDIVKLAQCAAKCWFQRSRIEFPGHKIPLICILGGRDDCGKGFICSVSSGKDFHPCWIREAGQPFFSGSKTELVTEIASKTIRELSKTDEKLKFDKWATNSIQKIALNDSNVGLPVQLGCAQNTVRIFDSIPPVILNKCFEAEFPPQL